jgi:hypothetical protein
MKIFALAMTIGIFSYGCNKDPYDPLDAYLVSEIVNFDYNCSTCILKFPNDSLSVKQKIGASRDNTYQTINLMKDTFKIKQRLLVKLREGKQNELRACKTLFQSYDYRHVYIIDFKPIE